MGKADGRKGTGMSLIIGGAEDRKGECKILRELVAMAGAPARLVVITAASREGSALVGNTLPFPRPRGRGGPGPLRGHPEGGQ